MKHTGYIVASTFGLMASWLSAIILLSGGSNSLQFVYGVIGAFASVHFTAYLFADKMNDRGNVRLATFALASPALILGGMIIYAKTQVFYTLVKPDTENFVADCHTAGEKFIQLPSNPVHSIAYVWDGEHEPIYGRYDLTPKGRISSMGGFDKSSPLFDKAIEFTERKRGYTSGLAAPYIRSSRFGFLGIQSLTADVVVTYRFIHAEELSKAPITQESVGYDLTVTDRRDGRKIAIMKYFVDRKNGRICGPIKDNLLSEKVFLAKALGLNE
jgi:hypothetical protein